MDETISRNAENKTQKTSSSHRRHSRRHHSWNSEAAIIVLLIVTVIIVLGTVAFNAISFEESQQQTRTINNVSVGNVSLYGMTVDEAITLLSKLNDTLMPSNEIVVNILDHTLTLTNEDTKARLDVVAIVNEAYLHGRGNKGNGSEKRILDPNDFIKMDTASVRSVLEEFVKPFHGIPVETTVTVSGERPVLTIDPYEGEPGQILTVTMGTPKYLCHTEAILESILSAYKNRQFEIIGEYTFLEPKPVTAESLFKLYCVSPINASVDPETLIFSKAVYGYGFDITELQIMLDTAQWGETIIVPLSRITPTVTDDMISG